MDSGKPVGVLNGFQIAVHHELAVRSPHLPIEIPGGGSISGGGIIVGIGPALVQIWKITVAPGELRIVIGITVLLPVLALAKEAGILELLKFLAGLGWHALLFPRQNLIEGRCAGEGAAQDETREVLLILERISLGQNATIRV